LGYVRIGVVEETLLTPSNWIYMRYLLKILNQEIIWGIELEGLKE
jgi:hypothetical protein